MEDGERNMKERAERDNSEKKFIEYIKNNCPVNMEHINKLKDPKGGDDEMINNLIAEMKKKNGEAPAPANEEAPAPENEEAPAPENEEAPAPANEEAPAPANEEALPALMRKILARRA